MAVNIPNGCKIFLSKALQNRYAQIRIFDMKIYRLATLVASAAAVNSVVDS
jgi:hypothetical protein